MADQEQEPLEERDKAGSMRQVEGGLKMAPMIQGWTIGGKCLQARTDKTVDGFMHRRTSLYHL